MSRVRTLKLTRITMLTDTQAARHLASLSAHYRSYPTGVRRVGFLLQRSGPSPPYLEETSPFLREKERRCQDSRTSFSVLRTIGSRVIRGKSCQRQAQLHLCHSLRSLPRRCVKMVVSMVNCRHSLSTNTGERPWCNPPNSKDTLRPQDHLPHRWKPRRYKLDTLMET